MLTTDLVRVRRRDGRISASPLREAERKRLLAVADAYVAAAQAGVGRTRGEFEGACDGVPSAATDYKLVKGLRKLVRDRCTFELRDDVDPPSVRRAVFAHAAEARRALNDEDHTAFDRDAVIGAAAARLDLAAGAVPTALFADLKANHVLTAFDALGGPDLVDRYELAQQQAILLRAVRVAITFRRTDPGGLRLFFRRLKFHRLLYRATRLPDDACRVEIDGPFSLFQSVTTYGLQLAMLLPVLPACGPGWELQADIRWGSEQQPLEFRLEGEPSAKAGGDDLRLPDDVARLCDQFDGMRTPWNVAVAHDLLDLPGVGLCVPDLVFTHEENGRRVYLEVLGYWSREAVWRRVDLVEAGLPQPIVFAVSRRLRVSEEVLDENLPGRLYVYKGVMSARAVEELLDASLARAGRQARAHFRRTD